MIRPDLEAVLRLDDREGELSNNRETAANQGISPQVAASSKIEPSVSLSSCVTRPRGDDRIATEASTITAEREDLIVTILSATLRRRRPTWIY